MRLRPLEGKRKKINFDLKNAYWDELRKKKLNKRRINAPWDQN